MRYSNQGRFRQQVRFLRRQFLQDGNLPFTNVLSDQIVSQALTAAGAYWVDRIYSPLVTLWVFLGQVLSADHSCRAACVASHVREKLLRETLSGLAISACLRRPRDRRWAIKRATAARQE